LRTKEISVSEFDEMVECFTALGLSPDAARIAAIGREYKSEAEAREAYREADVLREAERAATAAVLGPNYQAPRPEPETRDVVEAVRARLGMSLHEATEYAKRLREREVRRAGAEHARSWMAEFAKSLTASRSAA
jgi:hypothetical protein